MTVCLMCSAVKRTANKWWRLALWARQSYYVWPASGELEEQMNNDRGPQSPRIIDLCGEGCLAQAEQMIRAGQPLPEKALER